MKNFNLNYWALIFLIAAALTAASIHFETKSGQMLGQYTKEYIDSCDNYLQELKEIGNGVQIEEIPRHR